MYTFVKGGIGDDTNVQLQLLNQHTRPEWGGNWCGPTAAGTSLAWFAETNPFEFGSLVPDGRTHFAASLDGGQEVPSTLSSAKGVGIFTLNADETEMAYQITFDLLSLTGDFLAAHIHNAQPGVDGGIVHNLSFVNGTATGVWTSSVSNPQALTPVNLAELLAGNLYVNVHSTEFTCGEIRGQILAQRDFTATLDGSQEVPATPSAAKGTAIFNLNPAQTELVYQITVDLSSFSGGFLDAHIHNAPAGVDGGIVHNLSFVDCTATGVWTSSDFNPVSFTPDMVAELLAGRLYVNVHSTLFAGGEIRGQIHATGAGPVSATDKYDVIATLGALMGTSSGDGTTDNGLVDGIEAYIDSVGLGGEFVIKVFNHPTFGRYANELQTGDEDVLVGITSGDGSRPLAGGALLLQRT